MLLLALISLLLMLILPLVVIFAPQTDRNLPPSPFFCLLRHLPRIIPSLHRTLRDIAADCGPIIFFKFGRFKLVIISSVEGAHECLKNHDVIFSNRPCIGLTDKFFYRGKEIIFSPYGDEWREARKVAAHFLSSKRAEYNWAASKKVIESMVEQVLSVAACGREMNMHKLFRSLTAEVMWRTVLGNDYFEQKFAGRVQVLFDIREEVSKMMVRIPLEDCFPRFAWLGKLLGREGRTQRSFRIVDEGLDKIIKDHSRHGRNPEHLNLVDILLSCRDDATRSKVFDEDCIKGIIIDMFTAGADTTLVTLEWAMAELACNPDKMKKLQEEIRGIVTAKDDQIITNDELNNNDHFLKATIKEVLRLHPPIPFVTRSSTEETKLLGYDIPSGAVVLINAWSIQRDPSSWDSPEEFKPERFLGSPMDFRGHDFQYTPFGAGRRMCPGIWFSVSLIELVLANLMLRFDWSVPRNMQAEGLDMRDAYELISPRKSTLFLSAKLHGIRRNDNS